MVAHSYESINSAIHSRGESSVTQNADTSAVASGQELSINTNAIFNAGILASNLSLPDDEDAIPISHDNDGVNEMNEISTVMTGPNHLTSARETLLTGNTRIAAGTISNASASNEMNDISTVMTGPDHLTSALETLLTGNTRIAAGTISNVSASNEHRGECASYRNNYEQLQMRPQGVDNNTYTSLKDQITEL
ncbi:hypothetical protein SNE40_005413 [Patella caerulea]|uniref:Uncharacterized protein n=1 Tax=Patella caerulea TaxID=87958 RepID=A0AAN8QBD8_PATCE